MMGLVLVGAGLFSAVCAGVDADFFMNHRKARLFVALFGRGGARVFYVVLGAALTIAGIAFALNGPV